MNTERDPYTHTHTHTYIQNEIQALKREIEESQITEEHDGEDEGNEQPPQIGVCMYVCI